MYTKQIEAQKKLERICVRVFYAASLVSLIGVITITLFLFINGFPAILEVGFFNFLFGTVWDPIGTNPSFGILYMVLTSIIATVIALILASPLAIMVAVFITYFANKKIKGFLMAAVELLAGIPSVIFGFIGLTILVPFVANIFNLASGANMLSAIIVLAIMTLPTMISMIKNSLDNLDESYYQGSLALGASKVQTIFKVMVPAAKSGILTAMILGASRAIGETMAIIMVSGNVVNIPGLFNAVRFLTTGIQFELNYAVDLHRQVLFGIGLVLFAFILFLNLFLTKLISRGKKR